MTGRAQVRQSGQSELSGEEKAARFLSQVKRYAEQRSTAIIGPVVSRAWERETPSHSALATLEISAADVAAIPEPTQYGNEPVEALIDSVEEFALSGALELHVLAAILRSHPSRLVNLDFEQRFAYVSTAVGSFVAGRREDLARAYFAKETGVGGALDRSAAPPHVQHLLRDWWFGRTPWPVCPPLAATESAEGQAVDALLPDGLAADLRRHWEQIAAEARQLLSQRGELGDIWPRIYPGGHWQGVPLYLSSLLVNQRRQQNATWREGNQRPGCRKFPFTCGLLRGRMRSERWGLRTTTHAPRNEEEVTFFLLGPSQVVPHHTGQQGRVNVHLCLLNCERAAVQANGSTLQYRAGGLLAFDDGLYHSVQNHDPANTRVVLGLGVVHPQKSEEHAYCWSSRGGLEQHQRREAGISWGWWVAGAAAVAGVAGLVPAVIAAVLAREERWHRD